MSSVKEETTHLPAKTNGRKAGKGGNSVFGRPFTRTPLLNDFVGRNVSVITNDGRNIVGHMHSFDQVCNIVLENTVERIFDSASAVQIVSLGLFVVRGDNIAVVGLVDVEEDAKVDWKKTKLQRTGLLKNDQLSCTFDAHTSITSQDLTFTTSAAAILRAIAMEGQTPNRTLYVRNLSDKLQKQNLRKLLHAAFSPHGRVVWIVAEKTMKLRGQAFITFERQSGATAALRALHGSEFMGKTMTVQYAGNLTDRAGAKSFGGEDGLTRSKRAIKKRAARARRAVAVTAAEPNVLGGATNGAVPMGASVPMVAGAPFAVGVAPGVPAVPVGLLPASMPSANVQPPMSGYSVPPPGPGDTPRELVPTVSGAFPPTVGALPLVAVPTQVVDAPPPSSANSQT